jgi:hypothetical protein
MATIKSTITLQSSGLFPGNINSTSINTTELSSSSSLQTVNVYKQFGEGTFISNQITAAHGAILYAQSPASNKRNICIYSVSSIVSALITAEFASEYPGQFSSMPSPLMTLRPGESAMTRISIETNQTDFFGPGSGPTGSIVPLLEGTFDDLFALYGFLGNTTSNSDDVATLDYILAEQGGTVGTSIGVLTTEADRWQHQSMDFEKGTMSQLVDLGLDETIWYYSTGYGIHEKGYLWKFYDEGDLDQHSYRFIGPNGERVGDITNETDTAWFGLHKSAVVVYRDSTELVFTVFDGVQVFEYRIVAQADDYDIVSSDSTAIGQTERCMADGSVVVTVSDNNDAYRTYILSNGNEPAQIFNGSDWTNQNVDFYISEFADTVIVADYSGNGVNYDAVQIWNKSGVKLKEVDLTDLLIDDLDVYPYGSGCWAIVGKPEVSGSDDLIRLFAYDPATGILHGEDLNWEVDRSVYDGGVVAVCEPKHLLASYDYDKPNSSFDNESLAFIAYDNINIDTDFFLDQQSNYLKVFTLFPGKAAPTEHDLAVDTTIYWRKAAATVDNSNQSGIYPTANYIRLHISTGNRESGSLQSVTIKPGTASPVYKTVANLAQINTGHTGDYRDNSTGISYSPFGDYAFYAFYTPGTDATSYRIVDARGNIVDTLTMPGTHTGAGWNGFRTRYNSLLIRTLDGSSPRPTWYFNTKTRKFVQLPETYRNQDMPNLAWRSHTNNGAMLLRDSNNSSVVKYWRILSNGIVSPKIEIPSQFSPVSESIDYHMGETYLFLKFADTDRNDKYTFLVYNLDGVLVNTVLTNYENAYGGSYDYVGNRIAVDLEPAVGNNISEQYCMITPTSSIANYWAYDVDNYWYNINDAKYND